MIIQTLCFGNVKMVILVIRLFSKRFPSNNIVWRSYSVLLQECCIQLLMHYFDINWKYFLSSTWLVLTTCRDIII